MISKLKFWTVASALALLGFAGSSAVAWRLATPGAPLAKDHVPGWRFAGDPATGERR